MDTNPQCCPLVVTPLILCPILSYSRRPFQMALRQKKFISFPGVKKMPSRNPYNPSMHRYTMRLTALPPPPTGPPSCMHSGNPNFPHLSFPCKHFCVGYKHNACPCHTSRIRCSEHCHGRPRWWWPKNHFGLRGAARNVFIDASQSTGGIGTAATLWLIVVEPN